jgi:hypothetical protein
MQLRSNLAFSLMVTQLGSIGNWQFSDGEFSSTVYDTIPPVITLGSSYGSTLLTKPFTWNCDIRVTAINTNFSRLERATAVLSNGFEWAFWKEITLRAGIGELAFDSDIFDNRATYRDNFTLSVSAGVGLDASRIVKGLIINYGLATDKVGAGINQQLDCVYHF